MTARVFKDWEYVGRSFSWFVLWAVWFDGFGV